MDYYMIKEIVEDHYFVKLSNKEKICSTIYHFIKGLLIVLGSVALWYRFTSVYAHIALSILVFIFIFLFFEHQRITRKRIENLVKMIEKLEKRNTNE